MKGSPKSRVGRVAAGCLAALLVGLGTVGLMNVDAILAGGAAPPDETWPILAVHFVLVTLPFIVLSLLPDAGRVAWLTAGVLTVIVWSLPSVDQLVRKGDGGANIGLGIFMLISPLLILGGALVARASVRWRARRGR